MNHFVFLSFYFGAKNGSPALGMANSLVVRRVSPGRIIVVLFWTKYAIPHQIKPGIHKLTSSRGQLNLCTVFIFVSREEKGFYRIVSLGHQNFDCRSYCGLSRRMQGLFPNILLSDFAKVFERKVWRVQVAHLHNVARALSSPSRYFQLSTNLGKDFFRYFW